MIVKKRQRSLARLFSRKRWRLVQLITGIHCIHHIRWGGGWTFPFTRWAYFEARSYTVDFVFRADYGATKTDPAHWERLEHDREHHDCTKTGRY